MADGVAEKLAAADLDASAAAPGGEEPAPAGEQVVTPWDVQGGAGGIDYDKLIKAFGCQAIDADLIARCVCRRPAGGRIADREPGR